MPSGLPSRLVVGLMESSGDTWMRESGVPWDVRYSYFTKGWVDGWGFGPHRGFWGLDYFRECAHQGFIPAVAYYQIKAEPGGGESALHAKLQNAATMRSYFQDFKVLMERAWDFGLPVVILVEADAFGLLEGQTGANPDAYAAVAATGLPELSNLPDTVAGWGLAFLQLRRSAGATNAILGIHVSTWATGKDVAYVSVTEPLQPQVDAAYEFLKPFGLAPNVTGDTFDVLVGDPLDRDANYYHLVQNRDRWLDPDDSASVASKSFNRYAEWMRLWNVASGKRWVLWQIPIGNSNSLDVYDTGKPREGYKDNRAEYFFGAGDTAHLEKFAASGAIALLFGRGAAGMSTYTNDYYVDGELFLKSRAGALLSAGGLAIPASPSSPPAPSTDSEAPPAREWAW